MTHTRFQLIPLIIVSLSAFAVLKLAGLAVNFSGAQAQSEEPVQSAMAAAPQRPVQLPSADLPMGEVERRVLERLADRRRALDAREENLLLREAVVTATEARLAKGFRDFEQERNDIIALREERDEASREEIDALVSAYEKMKARDAAAIFNELDNDIMLAVASNMRTQALAGVLANMTPSKARALTVLLAERGQIVETTENTAP